MLQASRSHRLARLAIRARVATLPAGVMWGHFAAAGMLDGTGLTVSLFIAGLASAEEALAEPAKVGILLTSVAAAATDGLGDVRRLRTAAQWAGRRHLRRFAY